MSRFAAAIFEGLLPDGVGATYIPGTNHFTLYELRTGAAITTVSYTAVELLSDLLRGWRERLYDYNPRVEGLYEGDLA